MKYKRHLEEIKKNDVLLKHLKKLEREINFDDPETLNHFGSSVQEESEVFSDKVLEAIHNKDLGDMGGDIKKLVKKIKENDTSRIIPALNSAGQKPSFLARIFQKARETTWELQLRMQDVKSQIDTISATITQKAADRAEDNKQLEAMHDKDLDIIEKMTDYIDAGYLEIDEIKNGKLPALKKRIANMDPQSFEYQALSNDLSDMESNLERLEQRIHNLFLSRQLMLQDGPTIRMIQNSNNELVDQIDALNTNAIPAWKKRMAMTISVLQSAETSNLVTQIHNVTNDSIEQSAKLANKTTVQIARESSRSVIDVKSLQESQNQLLDALDKISEIKKGRESQRIAERSAVETMNKQLKASLLNQIKDTRKDVTDSSKNHSNY